MRSAGDDFGRLAGSSSERAVRCTDVRCYVSHRVDDAAVAARLGLTTVAQSLREQGAVCARAALGQRPDSYAASWSIVRRASTRL